MNYKEEWARTRDRLVTLLLALGYPAELGDMIAKHIGSPKGMERMISYLEQVRPDRIELIADEMVSIRSDIDRWREKKASQQANIAYNNVVNNGFDS